MEYPNLASFLSDPQYAASPGPALPPAPPPVSGLLGSALAGLKAGSYDTGSAFLGAGSGLAKIVGADSTSAYLGQKAQQFTDDARQVSGGLDQQGFTGNGPGGFVRKAAYTAGSLVPTLVGAGVGGVAATAALPEEGAIAGGALIGRLGASLPKFFGGSGVGAGFAAGVAPEALTAGANLAAGIGGAGAFMGAQSSGEQVNEAAKQPGGLTRGDAARAFAQGIPIGLIQGVVPAEGALSRVGDGIFGNLAGGAVSRAATRGFKDAAVNAVGAGLQAAADTSFDPNMSASDKASQIVSAAAGGAAVGGLIGAGLGLLHKPADPSTQKAAIDGPLADAGLDPSNPAGSPTPPPPPAPAPVQQDLPFSAPLQSLPSGTQVDMFGAGADAKGQPLPYSPGVAPAPRTRAQAIAEVKAQREAAAQAAAAGTPPPVDPAAPPVSYARQLADASGIKIGQGQSALKDFLNASPATNDVELHNEILKLDPTDPANAKLVASKRFDKLAETLGLDDQLDAKIAALQADPASAEAVARLPLLYRSAGIRDAAARARETPAALETPVAAPEPAPEPVAAPAAQAAPVEQGNTVITAPTIDMPIAGLEPVQDASRPSVRPPVEATTADKTPIEAAPIHSELDAALAPPSVDTSTPAVSAGPRAITDRVLDVARQTVGDKGGEVSVADIRAALPDLAPKDIDNALREIHGDDSDTTLVQAPKGQRTGLDGISIPGQGKFHRLELEAREPQDAVQEPVAAPPVVADQPGDRPADGAGDAGPAQAAGEGASQGAGEGQPGPDAIPADAAAAAAAPVADADVALPGPLPRRERYPGDAAKAADLGVNLPDAYKDTQSYQAVTDRLKLLHNMQTRGEQGSEDFASTLAEARDTFAKTPGLQPEEKAYADATAAKVVPQDTTAAKSPEQLQLDLGKQAAAGRLIAPGTDAAPAAQALTAKLRRQTRTKTALVETPEGDQVPTATIGADITDLPQATVSNADPLQPAQTPPALQKIQQDVAPGPRAPAMPIERTQALFDKHVAKLSPDVQANVHLVRADTPIPGQEPMAGRTLGLYHNGQVWVNADMVRNAADLEDTIAHEVFGHYGNQAGLVDPATGRFNEGVYQARMFALLRRTGGPDGIERIARQMGVWAKGDDGGKLNGGAGMKAYFPPDGTQPTAHQYARLMDELIAHQAGSNPSMLDRAILKVQAVIQRGLVNTMRQAGLHEFAKRMDRFGPAQIAEWTAQTRKALTVQPRPGDIDLMAGATTPRHFIQGSEPTGQAPFMASLAARQRDTEGVMGVVENLRQRIVGTPLGRYAFSRGDDYTRARKTVPEALRGGVRSIVENLAPANEIAEHGQRIGLGHSLMDDHEAIRQQGDVQVRLEGPANQTAQAHMDLRRQDAAQEGRLARLMPITTLNNLDPERPWSEHTWHIGVVSDAKLAELRDLHAHAQSEFQKLGLPGKGGKVTNGQQVWRDQRAVSEMNWYMGRAMHTQDAMRTVYGLDTGHDAAQRYAGTDKTYVDDQGRNLAGLLHDKVAPSRDYWKGEFDRLNALAKQHLDAEDSRHLDAAKAAGVENLERSQPHNDLADLVKGSTEGEKGYVQQGPYFRMGREGDFAVGFNVKPEVDATGKPTGRPDPASLTALQEGFKTNFPQIQIGASTDNPRVFARFQSEGQARDFHSRVAEGGELRDHIDPEVGTHVSLLAEAKQQDKFVPFMQTQLAAAKAKFDREVALTQDPEAREALEAQRDKYLGNLRSVILDRAGDNSARSLQARREGVQGSSLDMIANQKGAATTFARAAAQTSFRDTRADALRAAREAIDKAGKSSAKDAVQKSAQMKRTLNAYISRNDMADVRQDNSLLGAIKSTVHTYQLGASPAYVLMNLSQLPGLTMPELVRMHSYARTIPAMVSALGPAGKIIKAMWSTHMTNSDGSRGAPAILQGGLTREVLANAGLSRADMNSYEKLANMGHLELNSYSTVNSGLGYGNLTSFGKIKHFANSTALMAELLTRIVAGHAAMKLYDSMPAGQQRERMTKAYPDRESYAGRVIGQSMLEWGSANTPKLFTAGGALGSAGPLVGQFHGFTPRLVGLLYRNAMDAFTNRTNDPAAKKEAQRFMMAHFAATFAMAGTMGLPLVSTMLAGATKASGLFLDQPFDFEAGIRNFLADTFGKDMGEVVSKGLPRYLGVDMSELGDNNFLPLSRLLEDRQAVDKSFPAYLAHAWGSAPSLALNAFVGLRDMSEGRFTEGLARALPTSLRNIARAYRVSEMGYTNSVGEKLPVPSGPAEVMKTALGLTGGELAEERERQEKLEGLRDDRQYRVNLIKRKLAMSRAAGDDAGVQSALGDAAQYDRDNPGLNMAGRLTGYLQQRAMAEAYGQKSGTLGVDPKDRVALSLIQH